MEYENLDTHMIHGVISTPPNPYRRGGPYDGQFSFRRDGEELPDFDLVLLGGGHFHFQGPVDFRDLPSIDLQRRLDAGD